MSTDSFASPRTPPPSQAALLSRETSAIPRESCFVAGHGTARCRVGSISDHRDASTARPSVGILRPTMTTDWVIFAVLMPVAVACLGWLAVLAHERQLRVSRHPAERRTDPCDDLRAELDAFRRDFRLALWIQGAAIIAANVALIKLLT